MTATVWEYHVIAAPKRGAKLRGARTVEDRFAAALQQVMNDLGAEGWDYVRSDTLPVEERQGLTGRTTTTSFQTMLVFRRPRDATVATNAGASPVPAILRPAEPPARAPAASPAGISPQPLSSVPPAPLTAAPPLGPARSPDRSD